MRIAINCHSFLSKSCYAGIGRYAFNLVKSLSDLDQENTYLLYGRKSFLHLKRQSPCPSARNFQVKIDRFKRGWVKTLGTVDIYHAPGPEDLILNGAKFVVTVHDLVFKTYPKGHTLDAIRHTENSFEKIVKYADKIICCSQNTLDDLHRYFSVDPKRCCLIYQGVDKECFYPIEDEEKVPAQGYLKSIGVTGPFILFVGTIEPRKNLANLLRAFALLKQKKLFGGQFVIAGMKGWMTDDISGLIQQCRIKQDVVFAGYVTNAQLRYLYNETDVFVFPSFYEGFGFPIVEAFSCGTAVVTSNVSSCPEIASDAAITVNPYDPVAIAEGIGSLLRNQKLKAELKARALKRAQDFSFAKTAQATWNVYREVYAHQI